MDVTMIHGILMVIALSFVLNIPLGIWRAGTKKFSLYWFLAIHLAVPIIYYIRVSSGVTSWSIPMLIVFAVIGQILGGYIYNHYVRPRRIEISQE